MFQSKVRHASYSITKPSGDVVNIPVLLNERGLASGGDGFGANCKQNSATPGSEYIGVDCQDCERHYKCCKAELAIAAVADAFNDLQSIDEVIAEAETEGRVVTLKAPAPRALASLMGLLMASSGCPQLIPFRAMALFHQPFATAEENVIRAAGFWLMRCWSQGEQLENPYEALQAVWETLENVNRHVGEKLLARCATDVTSNGIAYLDVLAKMGVLGLDSAMDVLKPAFSTRAHQS